MGSLSRLEVDPAAAIMITVVIRAGLNGGWRRRLAGLRSWTRRGLVGCGWSRRWRDGGGNTGDAHFGRVALMLKTMDDDELCETKSGPDGCEL